MSLIRKLVAVLVMLAAGAGPAVAANFVVNDTTSDPDNNNADGACQTLAGTCSLRAAIQQGNALTGPHTITFNAAVTAITLTASLPNIRAQVSIDGTNAGAVGGRVDINGAAVNTAGGFNCFDFDSTGTDNGMITNPDGGQGSTLSNLVIRNCADDGISASGHGYSFLNNSIGVTPLGDAAAPNDGDGITLSGTIPPPMIPDIQGLLDNPPTNFGEIAAFSTALQAALTIIANPNFITGNQISGNDQTAITLNNPMTVNTFIAGNIIGLSANSLSAIPNGTGGGLPDAVVLSNGAYGNFIGPGNIISGNSNDGINISGAVLLPNFIMGNLVGIGGAPGLELGNEETGIRTTATLEDNGVAPDNPTGFTAFIGPANVISDNQGDSGSLGAPGGDTDGGVVIQGEGVRFYGNAVGLFAFPAGAAFGPADQLLDVGNTTNGVVVLSGGHQIGGSEVFEANFILKNGRSGILVRNGANPGNIIRGNFIGVAPPTGLDVFSLGNAGHGIFLFSANNNTVGGPGDLDDNVIAANGINGVAVRGGTAWANLIQRNQIYGNGVTMAGVGIGIDLDRANDVPDPQPDPTAPIDPNMSNGNFGQNQPTICTGVAMPLPACLAPAYNAGTGATSVTWSVSNRPNTTVRIEYFSLRPDGMSFLFDEMVTTDAAGLPVSGTVSSCAAGVCTASATPMAAQDTRGQSIVMTSTDLFQIDTPGGDATLSDANNTSEFSPEAPIPQEVAFSAASYSAGEAAGTFNLVLQRLGTPNGAVSVDVVVSGTPGSATGGGVDYTVTGMNPVTWADGDSADKTFTISITDDMLDEIDETVNFELANPTGAIEGMPNATTLTILDNDAPPTISVADTSVNEGDVTVPMPFTFTLSTATSFDVVVTYSTADGSAVAGADYTAVTNQMVTIAAGNLSAMASVDILGDLLDEDDETLLLNISATNTTPAGSDLQATGTIVDNDPLPMLSISDVGPLNEGDAGNTPFVFTLSLDTMSGRAVNVRAMTSDGTAVAPGDYTPVNQVVTIPAGMTMASLTVNVVGDTVFEPMPTETFNVNLAADGVLPLNATLLDPLGVGTITNDDASPGTLQFTPNPADQTVAEDVGSTMFTVSRENGSSGAVSTTISLGGSATIGAGNDYTTSSLTLNWADGDMTSQAFTITVNDDAVQEGDETVTMTLGVPTGGATLGVPSMATLTILANDAPAGSLQFTPNPADQTVMEDVGSTMFTVTRTGGSAGAVSTTIALGGTATIGAGNDYTTSALTLNWADGDMTSQTVTITVNDDALPEGDETVTLMLGAPTGGATLGVPSMATLTISANDTLPGSLQFTPDPADQSVMENVGVATFTVTRTGGTGGAVSTMVMLGGTATIGAGNDYTTSALMLSWADGDGTDRTITVTVNDDAIPEGDETVILTLGAPTGGATLGMPSMATLTILANDAVAGSLQFTPNPADQTVDENIGTATFTVTRTGGSAGAVSTMIALGGSATIGAGNDYTTSALMLSWADGDMTDRSFVITVNDDAVPEGNETVTMTLGAPTGGATLGMPSMATLTITANDAVAGVLQFTPNPADQIVAENVGTATFTVTRTGGSSGAVGTTVMLGGTATIGAGNDYTTSSLMLSWADGDATDRTITITVNDDALPEGNETVILTLGAPTGGAMLGVPSMATLTISANDAAGGVLQFTPANPDQTVAENVGTATFTVTRTGGSSGAVGTQVMLGGSATLGAGNDYTTSSLMLSWADGDATDRTITITVNDDALPEGNETVTLTLGAPTGGATLGMPAMATLTITANDAVAGVLQFTPANPDQTVAENAGTATFTVTRTGGSSGAVSTTVSLGGSATPGAGNDYTTSALTLNWADGDATNRTVTITINDDATPEGTETVTLTLGAPTGGAMLGMPTVATLTITDNDAQAGAIQFAPLNPNQTVGEAVGNVTFLVSRSGGSSGAVSAMITLGGTATAGADYTNSATTLTWADGDAADKSLVFSIIDDGVIEPNETVTLTLANPGGGATLGARTAATLTIVDNDSVGGQVTPTIIPATSRWSLAVLALLMLAVMARMHVIAQRP